MLPVARGGSSVGGKPKPMRWPKFSSRPRSAGGILKRGRSPMPVASARMKSGNWIKGAIKKPGSFGKAAKKAGKSTSGYAKSVLKKGSKASGLTKKRASLALTLGKMRRKKG